MGPCIAEPQRNESLPLDVLGVHLEDVVARALHELRWRSSAARARSGVCAPGLYLCAQEPTLAPTGLQWPAPVPLAIVLSLTFTHDDPCQMH